MQAQVLKAWCQAMLQAFSSCKGGCPASQLAAVLDRQLALISGSASWAQLFGSTSPDKLLAGLKKLDPKQLQVCHIMRWDTR